MGIRIYKPTSPGRRNSSVNDYAEVTKATPEKTLVKRIKKHGGRNHSGKITCRFRGGGARRIYRMIDFKRFPTEGVRHPGMWAEHAIALRRPMRWGQRFRIDEHLAEKGASGRTRHLTFEFGVHDAEGEVVAVGRHKCKFITQDS